MIDRDRQRSRERERERERDLLTARLDYAWELGRV
jgi:hypothetical protein